MFAAETYAAVRRFVFIEGPSRRDAARAFGLNRAFAVEMRRCAPQRGDKRHLDEVAIPIAGKKHGLWRAVANDGFALDALVQARRDRKAARRA